MPVIMFGDWEPARRRFNGLAFKFQRAAGWGVQAEATAMARRIKNNIFAQNYVGHGHPPDAQSTVERKEEAGKDTRTLIEDAQYVNAIEPIRLARYEWAVGVRDPVLAFVGELMEWGFYNVRVGREVPARPHFRVEMERLRTIAPGQRLPSIANALARVLDGTFTDDAFTEGE